MADRAKVREMAVHRRALVLHERAVSVFEGQGDTFGAGLARDRGERARDRLAMALEEPQLHVGDAAIEGSLP